MGLELYREGYEQARRLIEEGKVSNDAGQWHVTNPGTGEQDTFIAENGIEAWGLWHLAVNPDHPRDSKEAYGFPYGNYQTVCREGLLAAEERSRQYGYTEINAAATELLGLADEALGSD